MARRSGQRRTRRKIVPSLALGENPAGRLLCRLVCGWTEGVLKPGREAEPCRVVAGSGSSLPVRSRTPCRQHAITSSAGALPLYLLTRNTSPSAWRTTPCAPPLPSLFRGSIWGSILRRRSCRASWIAHRIVVLVPLSMGAAVWSRIETERSGSIPFPACRHPHHERRLSPRAQHTGPRDLICDHRSDVLPASRLRFLLRLSSALLLHRSGLPDDHPAARSVS